MCRHDVRFVSSKMRRVRALWPALVDGVDGEQTSPVAAAIK
jgi:hypothetical protein